MRVAAPESEAPAAATSFQRFAGTLASLVAIALVGIADYATGPDVGFSLFYLVPIVASGYLLGVAATSVSAAAASLSWFLADYIAREQDALLWISTWNASTRLAIFLGVGLLTTKVVSDRRRLQELLAREHVLSRTDALTGLANSRALLEAFEREIARAERSKVTPCAVVFFDLDNFKRVNDRFGHAEGDRVLQEVGRMLAKAVRATDVAARMGGDEFVALLWDVDEARARLAAERVIAGVAAIALRYPATELGLSAGVAVFPQPPASADELLKQADTALYESKRTHKGGVTVSHLAPDAS